MLEEAVSGIRDVALVVAPTENIHVVTEDPDDDRVIECAIASGSQFIISGDNHLLRLNHYENIRILKLSEFLRLIPEPA
jgi:predicted nucleic acid-binding protein